VFLWIAALARVLEPPLKNDSLGIGGLRKFCALALRALLGGKAKLAHFLYNKGWLERLCLVVLKCMQANVTLGGAPSRSVVSEKFSPLPRAENFGWFGGYLPSPSPDRVLEDDCESFLALVLGRAHGKLPCKGMGIGCSVRIRCLLLTVEKVR
jgi:hypothetical protein